MRSRFSPAAALAVLLATASGAPASAEPLTFANDVGLRLVAATLPARPDPALPENIPAPAKDTAATDNPPARDAGPSGGLQPNPRALLLLSAILKSGRFSCCR